MSRDAGEDDTLWFPLLTALTLVAHRPEGEQHHPTVPQHLEEALVAFLGNSSQRTHHNAPPMQNLVIRGLVISEEFERHLKSLVENVEVSLIPLRCFAHK